MSVYTVGVWTVKPGREDEFVDAWREMAVRTREEYPGRSATLLRDRRTPNLFIGSGPWESMEQIEQWRLRSPAFGSFISHVRELIESFTPHTMDPVAMIV